MATPLLSTKLHIPPPRPNGVARPRLTEKLQAGLLHPCGLVLLSGPAGFGKTSLLSEFAVGSQPVAWISLDEADNDPIQFWNYLIAVRPGRLVRCTCQDSQSQFDFGVRSQAACYE